MEAEFLGDKRCPVCGKRFTVLWPNQWAYKRGKPNAKYYCSWKCLRTLDNEKGDDDQVKRGKLTLEQKKRAVQIALDGGDPLRYLQQHGSGNPTGMWYTIKQHLKETDPETYEKLPKRVERKDAKQKQAPAPAEDPEEPETPTLAEAMTGMKEATDDFFGKCEEMGLKMDKPKQQKITQPVNYDGMTVREVEGLFGRYRRTDIGNATYIDYESKDGADELSMTVEHWKAFIVEIRNAGRILGVEV